jgi:hypothetical protein
MKPDRKEKRNEEKKIRINKQKNNNIIFRGFDAMSATQLCKKASAKESQQGQAGYGEQLLRRSKRSCKMKL